MRSVDSKKARQARGNNRVNNHHGMVKLGIADQIYAGKKEPAQPDVAEELMQLARKIANKEQ